ncbi:hypothetical protein DV735_g1000, partial [Chaetothyriales sp. CBS 134920]
MQLYITLLVAFASTLFAAPVDEADTGTNDVVIPVDPKLVQQFVAGNTTALDTANLGKRATDYGFYQCSLTGFQGYCVMVTGVQDQACRKSLLSRSASMCPDKGILCTVYENRKCSGTGIYPFGYPGIADFLWDIWWMAAARSPNREPPRSYRCQIVHSSNDEEEEEQEQQHEGKLTFDPGVKSGLST